MHNKKHCVYRRIYPLANRQFRRQTRVIDRPSTDASSRSLPGQQNFADGYTFADAFCRLRVGRKSVLPAAVGRQEMPTDRSVGDIADGLSIGISYRPAVCRRTHSSAILLTDRPSAFSPAVGSLPEPTNGSYIGIFFYKI